MDLNTLSTSLDLLSLSELQKAKDLINLKVNSTAPFHVSSFVHVQNDFISFELSSDIQEDLWKRIKEPGQNSSPNSVRYLWLSKTQGCYKFSGHEMLTPLPFKENDPLLRVMAMINRTLPWHQWLDSCLLAFYLNGEIGVNYHDDDEIDINQDCPIKNVSLSEGEATRNILFKAKAGSNFTGSLDLTLANCSLMTMEPGCQKGFLHSVPPQNINKGRRILLSYRKAADPAIVKLLHQGPSKLSKPQEPLPQAKTSPPPSRAPKVPVPRPCSITDRQKSLQAPPLKDLPKSPSFLILGTSITKRLDLGPDSLNISESGATIQSLTEQIKEHHSAHQHVPSTILINAGTKDILFKQTKRAQDLKAPLLELLQTTKNLYPESRLMFMSMLPVDTLRRGWPPRVCTTVTSKVLAFNRLARHLCKTIGAYHVHLLSDFLNPDKDTVNRSLFWDYIHLNKKGTFLLQQKLQPHLAARQTSPVHPPRPASTAPPPPARRVPVNLMANPLPQTLPLDDTPTNLDSPVLVKDPASEPSNANLNSLSVSNVSSEIEITKPIATSSPPSSPTTYSPSKSLAETVLDTLGISSIVAPNQPT